MITASIVTYNQHLLDIESILRSLMLSPVRKVWVVDHSDSVHSLREEIQQFMLKDSEYAQHCDRGFEIEYLYESNTGYGRGNNRAIRLAIQEGSQFHLVVNPDVWFGQDVIPALWKYMMEHEDVGQMMPKVLFLDGTIQRLAKLLPRPWDLISRMALPEWMIEKRNLRYELDCSGYDRIMNVPCLSGCFMFFRISALKEIGLFDERYFMYGEDFDITRRMHRRYKTLLYPDVCIYHRFSRASRHSLKLMIIHMSSMIKYFFKWGWFVDMEARRFNKEILKDIEDNKKG